MKPKKRNPQMVVRRAATISFLRCMLSDIYSPMQVASVKFDARLDYGMDNEVIELFEKIIKRFGKLKRDMIPFEIFKLVTLYCTSQDIRGILGNTQIPEMKPSYRNTLTKLEKIREEIIDYQNRERPPTEPHMKTFLDFILKKAVENHKYLEMVEYEKDGNHLETYIDDLCDSAPKKELYGGHPGLQDHVVFLKPMVWTERGYAISPDLFTMYPELETFFRSKIGMAFYQNYMKYIGNKFPNMQNKILDHVNAFASQYFQWMVSMVNFPNNIPADVRWKYAPMETNYSSTSTFKKILLRFFTFFENGRIRRKFVFLHEILVVFQKLETLKISFVGSDPIKLSSKTTESPLVHEIAEFTNAEHVMMMIRKTIPNAEDSIEILDSELHAMGVIDRKCLPIVSPYNTHCIPSPQAFQRIVEILIDEVQIGRRIPLNFRCLEVLIKKMERIFVGKHIFKTMVDRNMVHELINEATELMEKFNGKLKKPKGLLGEITPDLSEQQKIEAFLDAYDQFKPMVSRNEMIPIPEDFELMTPPGEPDMDFVHFQICPPTNEDLRN